MPTTPTPPAAPTVSSVTVTGPASSPQIGSSAQFTATAIMSNGTSQTVSSQATWQSTATLVATVSSSGMVTISGAGDTDIRATYQGVSGSARISVSAASLNICGTIRDSANNSTLSGTELEMIGGPNAGRKTTSDTTGVYCFNTVLAGASTIRARRSGYDNADQSVTVTTSAVVLNFSLRSSATPVPGPTPTPGPTPIPGPNGPSCTAASIPANAACIGNGTPPVTAVCADGAFSCSGSRPGTCSTHGGVRCWVCPGALCNGFAITPPLDYTPVPLPVGRR